MRREPSLTLRGALGILGSRERPALDRLNLALGGVILASGAALALGWSTLAPAAVLAAIWGMTEQKNTALELLRAAVDWASNNRSDATSRERREVITAAHTTIVAAAFFEALEEHLGEECCTKLMFTDVQKAELITGQLRADGENLLDTLYDAEIPAPSAARGFEENLDEVGAWMTWFSQRFAMFLRGLTAGENLTVDWSMVTNLAVERYRSHFLQLAAKADEFGIWANLSEHAATRALVRRSNGGLAHELSQTRDALSQVFTLLSRIARPGGGVADLRAVMEKANQGILAEPILADGDDVSGLGITPPTASRIYINPRFRVALADGEARPADARWWEDQRSRDDFDNLLVAHVLSPDATRLPMLLLGDPGAGKSMLTKILAARLPAAGYTVVRVPLRRVTASARIAVQLQEALDAATNQRVSWPRLSEQCAGTIPVIMLDGLDELLQASDSDRSAYLQDVMDFQRTEAAAGRDVIVIVTSRIVVADRVAIPPGTTVVKLDAFTDDDVSDWLSRWNGENVTEVSSGTFRALLPEVALRYGDLARQPLLLLMLAVYTADPVVPALDAGLPTADLYQRLLDEFAMREARKTLGRDARPDELHQHARDHLDRLAIAALAMFNRGRQDASEDEVGTDLKAIDERLMTRTREDEAGQRAVGEFFFIHAAESRSPRSHVGRSGGSTRRNYEFIHATFGEYLVARYIMTELIEVASTFAGRRRTASPVDDLLFALLSHQPLAARRSTLEFARDICATLGGYGRRQVLDVLEALTGSYRDRHGSDAYIAYRPSPSDTVRRLACYSANLVSLRVALGQEEDGVSLPDLVRADGHGVAEWRSTVLLWQSCLDPDGLLAILSSLTLEGTDPPRIRAATPTLAILSGEVTRVNDILLAQVLGDQGMEQRIKYGAAIWDDINPDPDEDLTSTLRYIGMNMLAKTRAKLANSPETREFLDMGLALLRTDLLEHTGADLMQGVHSRLFESLSRQRIIALAEEHDSEKTRFLGENMFRHRWARKDFYTADLIAYLFRVRPQERHFEEIAEAGRALMKEASFGRLVRFLAEAEMETVTNDPLSNLQAILQTALPKHPRVQEFSRAQYEYLLPRWAQLYEEVAATYGLSLADGYTWGDMALLFNSVVKQAVLRARAEEGPPRLSNGEEVLVGAIFAMVPTFLANCPPDLDDIFPV